MPVETVHNLSRPEICLSRQKGIAVASAHGSGDRRMTARRMATAQREAQMVAPQVTWGELGCPKEIGLYRTAGGQVRVKRIHIIVAEDDPAALFTVVAFAPPLGPAEFVLGHRVS